MRLILSPSRSGGGQSRVGQWTTGGTGRIVGHRSRKEGIGLQRRQDRRLDDVNAPRAELYPPVFDAPDVKLGLLHLPAINVRLVATLTKAVIHGVSCGSVERTGSAVATNNLWPNSVNTCWRYNASSGNFRSSCHNRRSTRRARCSPADSRRGRNRSDGRST